MADPAVQFQINDNKTFFADEISITNNPLKFIIDFKNTAPRVDVRSQQGLPLVIEHNAVMMDAFLAKNFHAILGQHIAKYEQQFGTITEPPQIAKAKKDQEVSTIQQGKPAYFG